MTSLEKHPDWNQLAALVDQRLRRNAIGSCWHLAACP